MTDTPNASLYAVDPDTGALTALPHFTRLAVSEIRNGIGKVEVDYPVYGQNFELLAGNTAEDRDLEVEVWLVGRQEHAVRGLLTDTAGDDLAEDALWRFEGWTLDVLLDEVLVWPQPGTDKQELVLSSNTAGTIVDYLIDQAQARGGLVGVTAGFSGSVDSNGDAWANVVTATFSPSATLLDVMQELIEIGMIDAFRLGADRVLQMWNPDGQGIDRTVTTPPVIFRRGRDLMESPRRHTVRNSATTVLAVGAENLYEEAADASALARRGRRIEVVGSANSLKSAGSVIAYAQQLLATITPGTHEVTHGLRVGPGLPIPWVDYAAGDWVWSDTRNTLDRLRIQQLELEYGPGGYTGSVVLNTVVVDRVSAIARKLKRISSGTAVVGTSEPTPEVDDGLAPAQVVGVTATSSAYVGNDGITWAAVTAGWTQVTTNSDTSLAGDIVGYIPAWHYTGAGMPAAWQHLPQVSGTVVDWSGVVPGKAVEVQVAAVDRWGHLGAWSSGYTFTSGSDATPPPVPSTPVVDSYLGLLTITWDGLGSVGEAQPVDFDRVEVHVSTSSGFTPSSSTRIDSLRAKGTIPWDGGTYDVTYYGKLVAYDKTGNESAASAQDSATLAQAADGDIGAMSIGKLTAGIMSAAMLLSGIIRTDTTGARFEADGAGWRLYRPSNTVSLEAASSTGDLVGYQPNGTSATFRLQASTGNVYLYEPNGTSPALQLTAATGELDMNGLVTSGEGRGVGPTLVIDPDRDASGGGLRRPRLGMYHNASALHSAIYSRPLPSNTSKSRMILANFADEDVIDGGMVVIDEIGIDLGFTQGDLTVSPEVVYSGANLVVRSNGSMDIWGGPVFFETQISIDVAGDILIGTENGNYIEIKSNRTNVVSNGIIIASEALAEKADNAKSFVIPHPVDDDRWLVHGCTESPTAGVEYTGAVDIHDGCGVVELPGYFEALCEAEGRTVQVAPVGVLCRVAAGPVVDGRFTVLSDAADGTRVNWLVKATRKNTGFPVEPRRGEVRVAGTGPYRYLTTP